MSTEAFNSPIVDCCGRDAADCDCPAPNVNNPGWAKWRRNFDEAFNAYLETVLWTSRCYGMAKHDDCRGEDCDAALDNLGFSADDFVPGAAREAEEDLEGFIISCLAERPDAFDGLTPHAVGYDFCLTRQGAGTGFRDRGLGERGTWLAEMSKPFGDTYAYVGDDGRLYVDG